MLAEGLQAIAAAEGQEQFEVPAVPQGEAHFHRGFLALQGPEFAEDPFPGGLGGPGCNSRAQAWAADPQSPYGLEHLLGKPGMPLGPLPWSR